MPEFKQILILLGGQASWAKMTSLGGKLTAPVGHPTKYVYKAEKPTYLSTNIGWNIAIVDTFQNVLFH